MKKIFLILLLTTGLAACSYNRDPNSSNYNPNDPGFVYAPEGDMYYSAAYKPMAQYQQNYTQYKPNNNPYDKDGMNMRQPPKGTIARGKLDYYFPYANTPEDYQKAAALKDPYPATSENLAEGKKYFETFCWQCHGKEGVPKGSIVAAGKFPPPTWMFGNMTLLKTLAAGKMFFSITYGKNLMGAHAQIVTPSQRWKIITYLKYTANNGANATATTDNK